jgi:uncharacterized protein with NAD-binding domain and iron-sulfur cluster
MIYRFPQFDKIYKLAGVPVITVQLRYNGWVTEMNDMEKVREACKTKQKCGEVEEACVT